MKIENFKFLFYLSAALVVKSGFSHAETNTSIPEIGPHQKVLIVEKNKNPENILIVYTKLDANCNFANDSSGEPIFDFYWLLNGTTYKAMNPILRSGIAKKILVMPKTQSQSDKVFYVTLADLDKVDNDIADPRLEVSVIANAKSCDVQSLMRLGPSDQNALVKIKSLYGNGTGTINPKINYVTIKGTNVQTGQAVSRTYKAKK